MSQHPDFERLIRHYVRLWGPSEVLDIVAREITSAIQDGALADTPSNQGTYAFEVMTPDATVSFRCAIPRDSEPSLPPVEHSRERCPGCGIPIPKMPEDATYEEMLCNGCFEKFDKSDKPLPYTFLGPW